MPPLPHRPQELDISGCRNVDALGLQRLSNRAHLWAPKLHTLNVAGCNKITMAQLEEMLSRRPPRGCILVGPDGPRRPPDESYRRFLVESPSKRQGPEEDEPAVTPLRAAVVPSPSSTAKGQPTPASPSQWFQLSPSKKAPPALSYDGTKTTNRSKYGAVVRAPRVPKVQEMKPRHGVINMTTFQLQRWGNPADGARGDRHTDWAPPPPTQWFSWASTGERPPTFAEDDIEPLLAPVLAEVTDADVMRMKMGMNPAFPALQSCVDTEPERFLGITWDAEETVKVKRLR